MLHRCRQAQKEMVRVGEVMGVAYSTKAASHLLQWVVTLTLTD